jgi:hypothetical protein
MENDGKIWRNFFLGGPKGGVAKKIFKTGKKNVEKNLAKILLKPWKNISQNF